MPNLLIQIQIDSAYKEYKQTFVKGCVLSVGIEGFAFCTQFYIVMHALMSQVLRFVQ